MFNVTLISRKISPPTNPSRCQRKQNTVAIICILLVVILLNVNIVKTHYKPFL